MSFNTTSKQQIRSVKCCVLFDPSNGGIRHVHRVVTMEGIEEPSADQVEKRTLHLANERGIDTARLQSLHVDIASIKPGMRYTVDPVKRCLVSIKQGQKSNPSSKGA